MIYKIQLIELVTETLMEMGLYSDEARDLVLGTIAQESHFGKYIKQIKGPAKGICQMEPFTHDDIWNNFIKGGLKEYLLKISNGTSDELVWNLKYSIAMCRVHYLRVSAKIPDNLPDQAAYYKRYYNTYRGKATVEEYIKNFNRFVING